MMSAYRVWLDGLGLADIDPAILITDIEEHAPKNKLTTCGNARYDGLRIARKVRQSISVTISLTVRERNHQRRQAVLERIAQWAQGVHYLTMSTRPGQRLRVMPDALPTDCSSLHWTQEMKITFTAYSIPYWEDEVPVKVTAQGTQGVTCITPMGCVPCFLEAKIMHTASQPLEEIRLEVNGQVLHLQGLNAQAPQVIEIRYDDEGLLVLPFACRTADSCDDVVLIPGQSNTIAYQADQPVSMTFYARGRRL